MNKGKSCYECIYCTGVLSEDYRWCNVDGQDKPIEGWDDACDKFVDDDEYEFSIKGTE